MIDLPAIRESEDQLVQPTRRRLYAALSDAGVAMTTGELAERLRLHPNGVRVHLTRLADAGLVNRQRAPVSRGRPADAWSLAGTARPAGRRPSAYEDLGRWLARALRPQVDRDASGVQATGREIGRELAADRPATEAGLIGTLAALGFDPEIGARDAGRRVVRLCNCPYRAAVHENQPAVCALHRGITEGLLERLCAGASLERFDPHDPDEAGCELVVSGLPGDATITSGDAAPRGTR